MKSIIKVIFGSLTLCMLVVLVWAFIQYSKRPDYKPSNKIVHIVKNNNQFTLIRNGQPFEIKGAAGSSNFQILSEIGGNTIRVYDTVNLKAVLDEAEKFNLAVIVDIPIPYYDKNHFNYTDKNYQNKLIQNVRVIVDKHKNHPALLMWNIGNELNFPITLYSNAFNNTIKDLIKVIKEVDPNHPVSTATEGGRLNTLFVFFKFPEIDIYGFNIFGALYNTKERLATLKPVNGKFPYFISEWGSNGPWEVASTSWGAPLESSSNEKLNQLIRNYDYIKELNTGSCIGSLFFYWGNKQESTHTWFSMFDSNNKQSIQIKTLKELWNSEPEVNSQFAINNLSINNISISNRLILNASTLAEARVNLTDYIDSLNNKKLTYTWQLYPEAWQYQFGDNQDWQNNIPNFIIEDLSNKIVFKTPKKEGPYRLFVNIYDSNNYFTTANLPFYVLEKP